MACEACMRVVVKNMTGLSCTIFSGAGDTPEQKSLYVELYGHVELYYGMWSMLVCTCVDCDFFVCYFWHSLQTGLK